MRAPRSSRRMLVVEGYSDKRFFQGLQRHIGLAGSFDVIYPGDLSKHPGKVGAHRTFKLLLEEAAEPGRFDSIGICVDADFEPDGGFSETDGDLKNLLCDAEFRMTDADRRVYQHKTSGCKASFWIAPSHAADGYLESLALRSLADDESVYLAEHVLPYVASLNLPRFDARNSDRAKLYVYLAIQRKPDKSLLTLMDDGKVDRAKHDIVQLKNWLLNLFGNRE